MEPNRHIGVILEKASLLYLNVKFNHLAYSGLIAIEKCLEEF